MFAPANRLLWIAFWVVVPALTLFGIDPQSRTPAALLVSAIIGIVAYDAYRLNRFVKLVKLASPAHISAYKGRLSGITIQMDTPAGEVALSFPASFEIATQVAAAASSMDFAFTPQRRGEFQLERAFLSVQSKWRLWRLRVERSIKTTVRVFPDLSQDPASRKLFATLQQGQRVQSLLGRGREVERLRDYAPGDSFEEVYWKATARRGAPVTKVFQVERTQDIYVVVDGSRFGNRNQALERFVSAALLLAIAAEKNADNFGLVTFSNRVHDFVRAAHGKGHFHRCREAIFDLQPLLVSPDFAELFTFLNLRIRKRALLFFLTDLSDPLLAETFTRDASLVARRHVVMVNQIADAQDRPLFTGNLPTNESDVRTRLAGHLQWAKLRELEKNLSHIGVHMRLLKPEHASSDLIDQYLIVKQRQLL